MNFGPCLGALLCVSAIFAQTEPNTDVVTMSDGEKFAGQFEHSNGATFTFKSDALGEVTVPWAKVQEFQSAKKLAVIPKGVRLRRKDSTSAVPQGTVTVAGGNLNVTPASGPVQSVPVANIDHVLEEPVFTKAMENVPGFFSEWAGTVTAGASFVDATEQSETFTGAINLVRTDPSEDWLRKRDRTLLTYTESYGTISQPHTPEVKTSLFHAGLEQDEFFSPALFVFGQALLDHNYSQGLSLQQTYGGGLGWGLIHRTNQTLDLKAAMTYIDQQFSAGEMSKSLIASAFEEDYRRTLPRNMVLTEQLIYTPSWNESNAWSATANAALTLPVYKRISSSLGLLDSFLHDPPPGFRKNSFQITAGITYSLK